MDKYIVIIEGEVNNDYYCYAFNVVDEETMEHIKDLWSSIEIIMEEYILLNPDCFKSYRKNRPYFNDLKMIVDEFRWSLDINDLEDEWKEWSKLLEDFVEFLDDWMPYGTSDYDEVHTISSIEAYRLADDKPINLMK